MSTSPQRPLRAHQQALAGLVAAITRGEATGVTDILAAVTPGGGKSLLPVIAAARLIEAGRVERICWVVPRDSLRLQAEEAFADPVWRAVLGHALSIRAADNEPDPSRGLAGYTRTGFARELLQEAFRATRNLRSRRRAERGLAADEAVRGLGKLLVVAPDQRSARRYCEMLRSWMPPRQAERAVRLAISNERGAPEALAAFRLTAEPAILVTVAMAYEGLDAPEVAVVAALTHIRSRPWLIYFV